MTGHAHQTPAQIRAGLKHPVIDGDGHWVEYDPVFAEKMRKVGGDKAADGFLATTASGCASSMGSIGSISWNGKSNWANPAP